MKESQVRRRRAFIAEERVSPDGRLRFRAVTGDDGNVTLGFDGFPWHTHADVLAATTGLPRAEAVRRFLSDLLSGVSAVALWSVGGRRVEPIHPNDRAELR